MPFIFSERLPVPTLKIYIISSIVLFLATVVYIQGNARTLNAQQLSFWSIMNGNNIVVWVFFNSIYCLLLLFGKLVQIFTLGKLRETEQQNIQDFFWNFIFYKFIFVFGVYNAQTKSDIMCWISWFSLLGFLHQFGLLCKDRYEYLTSKPSIPKKSHIKLVTLTVVTYLLSFGMIALAISYGYPEGLNIFGFMIAECLLLNVKCFRVMLRYFLYFVNCGHPALSDYKMQFEYYSTLMLELLILAIDLTYHVHMLIWSNGFLSLASLVLYWNIRTLFQDVKQCWRRHRRRNTIVNAIKERFQLATTDDLNKNEDHCVICWEEITSARKLPCGHLFHHICLCSWLQQDTSCPTCRLSLRSVMGIEDTQAEDGENASEILLQRRNQGNSLFHFDGSRIASWLPTFSIEFFHYNGDDGASDQELEEMAERLYSMFPSVSREEIWNDLRRTRSAEETADNVISRHLLASSSIDTQEDEPLHLTEQTINTSESSTETDDTDTNAPFGDNLLLGNQIATSNSEDNERKEKSYSLRKRKFISDARRVFLEKTADETRSSNTSPPLQETLENMKPKTRLDDT